ncbi:hypothetical protein REPUB_Repub11eG0139300 [Reevesia pubescens]
MELEMNALGGTEQANGGMPQHFNQATEADRDWLAAMELKINQPPKVLNESAGKEACCIFKVPQSLVIGINENAYRPHIVSIGPYYHGYQQLQMIQEHKWRFLGNILARSREHSVGLAELYRAIKLKEEEITKCYSATIEDCDLVEMMLLDGCFIFELFWKVNKLEISDDDPLLKIAWVLPFIARDLLKLENQIPFFVLETLHERLILALGGHIPSMKKLTLGFFSYILGRPIEVLERHKDLPGKHILDLFRLSMIPFSSQRPVNNNNADVRLIPSAQKLRLAGIKFMPKTSDSFLDIEFKKGVLQIPNLIMDDFSSSIILNCIAFEQCYYYCSNDITTYATFMGCLISTPKDAEFLRDKKIIENYFGADDQVAFFFNNLGKDLPTDIYESYLRKVFEDVNEYSSSGLHVYWAGFINTYFRRRWSIISAIACSLILVSAIIQSLFTVYPDLQIHKSRKRMY